MTEYGFLPKDKNFATRAINTRYDPKQWDSWAVAPPIVLSTTHLQSAPNQPLKYTYGRSGNPTRELLEDIMAALENAKHGLCFSSGQGCVSAISHLLKAGDHLLATNDLYGGIYRMFTEMLPEFGVQIEFIDLAADINIIHERVKKNTKMIWIESPTNPTLKYVDLEKACEIAHQYNLVVVVDNTFLSSYFQKPLALGADIVMHSLTKYYGGHSDVLMGGLVTNNDEIYRKLRRLQSGTGIVPSPFDCYLVIRSVRTLHLRMEAHMESSLKIAQYLEQHPLIVKVLHPALKSHPDHEIAQKQTSGWSGMMGFYVKGGLKEATALVSYLKMFTLAESLGGHDSLIEIPAVMTHCNIPPEDRIKLGITDNLLRVSVGLESTDDLIDDLKNGLELLAAETK